MWILVLSAMVQPLLFYAVSAVTVAGALGVVLARQPVHAVLSLVLALFGLSALFVALGAYFVAMIQVLVYAGAVLVLFLFVIMLLDIAPEALLRTRTRTLTLLGASAGLFFLWQQARVALSFRPQAFPPEAAAGTTAQIGRLLFTTYALPFEAASLLLLVGIIGAVVLAKKQSTEP